MKKTILIVDDEVKIRTLLTRIIQLEGFEVMEAADCKNALKKLEQNNIDVVLCDVKLPDGNGVELSKMIKQKYLSVEIILLTAYGNIADGVQAIKNGAFDYITKGDDNQKIIPLLYKAIEKVNLNKKVDWLEKRLHEKVSFSTIIGNSKSIQKTIDLAQKVSGMDTTVLLTGETGTGKEVFAQAIHQASKRNKQNFLAVNCAAFSKDLLESELFGHKAGAFTGATKDQKGILEEAHHGTIFLDEIGEMHLDLQAKLLRVLENGEFIKIGENKPTQVDVRVIAATNRNLEKEIEQGRFREDLYYRISVFQIALPPLRERITDIEDLTNHFIEIFSLKMNKKVKNISEKFIQALEQHSWKGNIRELKNVIERSLILMDGDSLDIEYLPIDLQTHQQMKATFSTSSFDLAHVEKEHIQKVLHHTDGNKTEAAKLLNIAVTTLYRKLAEYQIQ